MAVGIGTSSYVRSRFNSKSRELAFMPTTCGDKYGSEYFGFAGFDAFPCLSVCLYLTAYCLWKALDWLGHQLSNSSVCVTPIFTALSTFTGYGAIWPVTNRRIARFYIFPCGALWRQRLFYANSSDLNETPSNSMSHSDPCYLLNNAVWQVNFALKSQCVVKQTGI